MRYKDALYGDVLISPLMYELSESSRMLRLREISQGVLPPDCLTRPIPSRYEHGMGAAHLALCALLHSRQKLGRYELLFVLAAMLHDAGNTGLSHLNEHFLKQLFKMDGESFLRVLLEGSDTARIIAKCGYTLDEVVQFVTGKLRPYSVALHGSLDVDNLDNVLRYLYTATGVRGYDAEHIASLYRFDPVIGWYMHDDGSALEQVRAWKDMRRAVYALIYEKAHLSAAAMVYQAVDLAVEHGEIGLDYFKLTDDGCLAYLYDCNPDSKYLVGQVLKHERFEQIFARISRERGSNLAKLCQAKDRFGEPDARKQVETMITERFGIPRRSFCCYAATGRDERRVTLPLISHGGNCRTDGDKVKPPHRLFVYLDPASMQYEDRIVRYMEEQFPADV